MNSLSIFHSLQYYFDKIQLVWIFFISMTKQILTSYTRLQYCLLEEKSFTFISGETNQIYKNACTGE